MKNPIEKVFQKKSEDEKIRDLQESVRMLNVAGDRARSCLTLSQFEAYKHTFLDAKEKVIEDMIAYTRVYMSAPGGGDISKYAFTVMRLLTKIEDFGILLKDIESAAARKPVAPNGEVKNA